MDPPLPEEVTEQDVPFAARAELKSLTKENATFVARHLAMAGLLIEVDPKLAHEHALSASRRGGRIAVVRETLAITAYTTGDFALALRELRTYRRISGRDDQLALMIDSERGMERPDRALELARSADLTVLPAEQRVQVAIALSGARLDQGKTELALAELEIPQLDPRRAFSYSPALFTAYADVLEELGRQDESGRWRLLAARAEQALEEARHDERETVEVHSEDLRGEELEAFYEAHPEARPNTVPAADSRGISADAGEDVMPGESGASPAGTVLADAVDVEVSAEAAGDGVPSDEGAVQVTGEAEASFSERDAVVVAAPGADADGAGAGVLLDEGAAQAEGESGASSPERGAGAASIPAEGADGSEGAVSAVTSGARVSAVGGLRSRGAGARASASERDAAAGAATDAGGSEGDAEATGAKVPAAEGADEEQPHEAGARGLPPERDAADLAAARLFDPETEVEELLAEPSAGDARGDAGVRGDTGGEGNADASGSDRGDDEDGPIVVETTLFDL